MSVLATEDFNRSDNPDLGADWDVVCTDSSRAMQIVSNRALYTSSSTNSGEVYTPTGVLTDCWVEVVISSEANALGSGFGITLRSTIGNANRDHYRLVANATGYEFGKFVADTFTSLANGTDTTFAPGDTLYLEVQGTTFVAKKNSTNGVGGTTFGTFPTDSAHSSGYAGIAFAPDGDPGPGIDSFVVGDFSGGAEEVTGTGALTAAPATAAGAGIRGLTGTGALTAAAATSSGSGTITGDAQEITGTGALTAAVATASGAGSRGLHDLPGPIALASAIPTVSGSGTVESPGTPADITGTGALQPARASASGLGIRGITGTGACSMPIPALRGFQVMPSGLRVLRRFAKRPRAG